VLIVISVAAQQYASIAEIFLLIYNPDNDAEGKFSHLSIQKKALVQEQSLKVCGMAFTNDNDAARVNAFGPMAFCESV